jgi:hypothetical protein
MTSEIQAVLESQRKIKAALPAYDILKDFLEYQRALTPYLDAMVQVQSTAHTITASFQWAMINFIATMDAERNRKYNSLIYELSSKQELAQETELTKDQVELLEAEYHYLPTMDEFDRPIQEREQTSIINESERIRKIIWDIYRNNMPLLQLQPRQFEELVAELLYHQGLQWN